MGPTMGGRPAMGEAVSTLTFQNDFFSPALARSASAGVGGHY
jgi:hypothetical protein